MSKIVIGLVGEMASGKGAIKEYLKTAYGAVDWKFSTPIRNFMKEMSVPVDRRNLTNTSVALRNAFGQDLFAKTAVKDVINLEADVIVLDGARRIEDVEYLLELSYFSLVRVDADLKTRYERLVSRKENEGDENKTFEEFVKDHENETEATIPNLMNLAKFSIDNSGNIESLHAQIDNLILKINK